MDNEKEIERGKKPGKRLFKGFAAITAICFWSIWALVGYYTVKLPDNYYVNSSSQLYLSTAFEVKAVPDSLLLSASNNAGEKITPSHATLKLFGTIPIKDVNITEVDRPLLVPGGTPFGIKLLMDGVMVIETGEVASGECPAKDAGIVPGDVILTINDKSISGNSDIKSIIRAEGENPAVVKYRRNGEIQSTVLLASYSTKDNCYQAGMWVRDSSAGIGTITFYNPETGTYGGLGHPICDTDTGEIVPISEGEIVDVQITRVIKGTAGVPGELCGIFTGNKPSGNVTSNMECGVFGDMRKPPSDSPAIPMGFKQEVTIGECEVLCTVIGDIPKKYKAYIEKIDYSAQSTKNMIVRITDERLLNVTGGIVQGMSGSPIIQNNMLIGAVTHVFVNDPAKGYGIFIENMAGDSALS